MDEIYNMILGMSHNYLSEKEITPDILREFIERMKLAFPDKKLDEEYIFRKLEAIHYVTIEGTAKTIDDLKYHENWFNPHTNVALNRDVKWHFWDHYREYMMTIKGWPSKIVDELDNISSEILSRIEDPHRDGAWDRRGMVMGSVQSGKTANYTALITKAVDAGYKLIIVLAGVHNSLRSQTQYRLNEEFLGYDLERVQLLTGQERRIGVRRMFGDHNVVLTLTSSNDKGDFNKNIVTRAGIIPSVTGDPIILVIKKNVSILKNIIGWATSVIASQDLAGNRIIKDIPALIIDDECDYASVNTKKPELDSSGKIIEDWDPTMTNKRIRQLLSIFMKSAYIGYTATPYANIFIHKDRIHPTYGEDLFPRSFIMSLPQASNYIGPDKIFGLDPYEEQDIEEIEPLPLVRIIDDSDDIIPGTHKSDLPIALLPESLIFALKCFLLSCSARMLRKEGIPHNTMLIHVTRYTNVQTQLYDLITKELRKLVSRIMSGSDQLEDFRDIWLDDFTATSKKMEKLGFLDSINHTWEEIKDTIYDAVKGIKIKEINGQAKDTLDYREAETKAFNMIQNGEKVSWEQKGISVIAIGGDKLSRGLTLDGLTVSYYLRASRMYDTLMQMGRWFGYREGYNDLCRIFTTQELSDWYRHIAGATIELRDEIDYMSAVGSTPEEFGLKVRSHPGRLAVTSAGKSRDAELIMLSYNNRISETVVFDPNSSDVNLKALDTLISQIGRKCDYPVNKRAVRYHWKGISADLILNFLRNYSTHDEAIKIVDPYRMAQYIEKQNKHEELTDWDVVIISKHDSPNSVRLSGYEIGCVKRTPITFTKDKISIRRLVSPTDESADLSDLELEEARNFDRNNRNVIVEGNKKPSGIAVRHVRPAERGLLLIYLPFNNVNKNYGLKNNEIVGFAISFPNSENAIPIEYLANAVHVDELI